MCVYARIFIAAKFVISVNSNEYIKNKDLHTDKIKDICNHV